MTWSRPLISLWHYGGGLNVDVLNRVNERRHTTSVENAQRNKREKPSSTNLCVRKLCKSDLVANMHVLCLTVYNGQYFTVGNKIFRVHFRARVLATISQQLPLLYEWIMDIVSLLDFTHSVHTVSNSKCVSYDLINDDRTKKNRTPMNGYITRSTAPDTRILHSICVISLLKLIQLRHFNDDDLTRRPKLSTDFESFLKYSQFEIISFPKRQQARGHFRLWQIKWHASAMN